MSFDGMFTHAMVGELKATFQGARIHKIQQPYDLSIVLSIRAQRKNHKLLISAHPSFARIQVTEESYSNPQTPPNFCMVLRKYIEGAIIQDIRQYKNDRIIIFDLIHRSEVGDEAKRQLVVELMGRHSNLILVDNQEKILDTIKHVPPYQNTYRTLLPNANYILPPQGDKLNPFDFDADQIQDWPQTSQAIQSLFMGFGRDSANELLYRIQNQTKQAPAQVVQAFCQEFEPDHYQATLIVGENKVNFLACDYHTLTGERSQYETLSKLLDVYYLEKSRQDWLNQVANSLIQTVNRNLDRNRKKLANLADDEKQAQGADDFRIKGELLTAYLYQLEKGQDQVTLANFYDQDQLLTIKLDPAKTPSENAQWYFKRYNKLNDAHQYIAQQSQQAQAEIDYLESVMTAIELSDAKELEDIRAELVDQGYLRRQGKNPKKHKSQAKTIQVESVAGNTIYIGRNNQMNDQLTMRQAHKDHYWFHTKDIPGSHVILATANPSTDEIIQAAKLAAAHSKYRHSANVPVDYTQVKHVKKPNGAKPGFVNYFDQQTVFVTPDQD
ncbi:fibronectin-binding protein [Aerococcus urinaehominis]|uniref:Rqc2 homolog RqcH n=1 Tax=Aerococcus urinaehominis TaxID=128944 RepID=A0A0X8FJK2_9LACT|nr:NFACT RNA binding domain-containing protein [Aerococcus urinaehominis]AMB98533.1 fibronectin-binding protein [Aerococcus urinaehominis]SDL79144.1 Predicted component of the ribosome quality control (RQC) complex, YloA/Tae2 family, contains fibronectin-binding (FbpA) and DUF814 domains [Aerococcus urinaehominis]